MINTKLSKNREHLIKTPNVSIENKRYYLYYFSNENQTIKYTQNDCLKRHFYDSINGITELSTKALN